MRRASQHVAVFCEEGNALLSFGYDYCSEHEWGIKGIHRTFGVSNDADDLTVGRYSVTDVPEDRLSLFQAKTKKHPHGEKPHARLFLIGGRHGYGHEIEKFATEYRESFPYSDKPEALWDENGFCFSVPVGFGREKTFRAVYKALCDKDALIYTSGMGGVFGGRGLIIARRSTIPREHIKAMEDGFADAKRLREASYATGIVARVEAWGRSKQSFGAFYALSPRWAKGFKDKVTKHPVIYWLNPTDQQNNEFGWFTVEELEQWMEGKGPIPKGRAA